MIKRYTPHIPLPMYPSPRYPPPIPPVPVLYRAHDDVRKNFPEIF